MSQQQLNFGQKIIDLLTDKWNLTQILEKRIRFIPYQEQPARRFNTDKLIVLEVYESTGVASPKSLGITHMQSLFKMDLWIRVKDVAELARKKAEEDRALLIDKIWNLIHDNQTGITGLKITTFGNWLNGDELESNPVTLHNSLFLRGEWFHKKS